MDAMKLAAALEQSAGAIMMNHTAALGVYRNPQDTDTTYAFRVLAATLRMMQ